MKTIKEEAIEYAKKTIANVVNDASKGTLRNYAKTDFIAGVEFAQRFIPVEKELPQMECDGIFSEEVLVKSKGNTYQVKRYDYELHRWTGDIYFIPISWRPIQLK